MFVIARSFSDAATFICLLFIVVKVNENGRYACIFGGVTRYRRITPPATEDNFILHLYRSNQNFS